MLNTGILKLNTSGGNKDKGDAASVFSGREGKDPAQIQKERLEKRKAERLIDESYVTHASTKEKLDESYRTEKTI